MKLITVAAIFSAVVLGANASALPAEYSMEVEAKAVKTASIQSEPDISLYSRAQQNCISDGRSCDPNRPSLCCSGYCGFTLWTGYTCFPQGGFHAPVAPSPPTATTGSVAAQEESVQPAEFSTDAETVGNLPQSETAPVIVSTISTVNPASVLDKRECDPNKEGCSACGECCVFKGNTAGCGQPAAVMTVLHVNECKPMGEFGIGMYAVWITECTGAFDVCILYQDANCPGGQIPAPGRSRMINNYANQCTNWAGAVRDFWVASIRCWAVASEPPAQGVATI